MEIMSNNFNVMKYATKLMGKNVSTQLKLEFLILNLSLVASFLERYLKYLLISTLRSQKCLASLISSNITGIRPIAPLSLFRKLQRLPGGQSLFFKGKGMANTVNLLVDIF